MSTERPAPRFDHFAWLPFTGEELKALHDLCDETLQVIGMDHADSTLLNSLRTFLAEAQYGLEGTPWR